MGRCTRDEINFHGFLSLMRKVHGVTLEQVCEGLCSYVMMSLIERGERLPDKLTRDRIMLRMGVAEEGYEDYLVPEEYEKYEVRQRLIEAMEERELTKAADLLRKYEKLEQSTVTKGMGAVGKQFILSMRYQLFILEKGEKFPPENGLSLAEREEACEILKKAISLTMKVPFMVRNSHSAWLTMPEAGKCKFTIKKEGMSLLLKQLLAEQEINLLIEYLWYQNGREALDGYDQLIAYIDSSKMDYVGRVKTYPKAVCYRIKKSLQEENTEEEAEKNFALCETAIGRIRGSGKSYYFVEILTLWEKLFAGLDQQGYFVGKRRWELLETARERKAWKEMFYELYGRYGASPFMDNFCYFYRETRSYSIGEIIRIRRNMLGITREELGEGICSLKTISRIEGKKAKTQMPIVRELFYRLRLNPEYIRERVISNDYRVFRLADRLAECLNTERIEETESILKQLREELNMGILQNEQFIRKAELELRRQKGVLSPEEFCKEIAGLLEATIAKAKLLASKEVYLSQEEEEIVYRLVMRGQAEEEPYLAVLEKQLENYKKKGVKRFLIGYEFLMTGYCSHIGDKKGMKNRTGYALN